MPVLLAQAIEDSTDIFGISGGGGDLNPPNHPLGTPLIYTDRRKTRFPRGLPRIETGPETGPFAKSSVADGKNLALPKFY
jgi:hypothetical protein